MRGAPGRFRDGSSRLKDASTPGRLQTVLLRHVASQRAFLKMYVAKSWFLATPRSIQRGTGRFPDGYSRFKDTSTRFKYGLKHTQDAFKQCYWGMWLQSVIFWQCIMPNHGFCKLQEACKVLQDAFKRFEPLQRRFNTAQILSQAHTGRLQTVLLKHVASKRTF